MIYFCRIEVTLQTSIVRGFDDGDKIRGVSGGLYGRPVEQVFIFIYAEGAVFCSRREAPGEVWMRRGWKSDTNNGDRSAHVGSRSDPKPA